MILYVGEGSAMPNCLTKRPLTSLSWAGIALLGSGLVLALLGIANLGFAAYFPLVGLWCSVALFVCACRVLRTAGVTLDFFHRSHFGLLRCSMRSGR